MDIYIQQIPRGNPVQVTNNPANDRSPSFSPDGDQIVFRSERDGGGLYVIDKLPGEVQGGEARRVSDRGLLPRFSPDGAYISYVVMPASLDAALNKMFLISSQGGAPKTFQPEFSAIAPETAGSGAVWSPDGKHVLFCGMRNRDEETLDWWVAPVDGGPAIRTNAKRSLSLRMLPAWGAPCAWSGDFIYYSNGTTVEGVNIFRVRMSPGSFQIAGNAEPVTAATGIQLSPRVARDGRMVFASANFTMNIWGLNATADQGTASGKPQKLTGDLAAKWTPFISRDGSKLAFVSFAGASTAQREIRIRDMASRRETSIQSREDLGLFGYPVLSADGSMLGYLSRMSEGYGSGMLSGNAGSASSREICARCRLYDFFSDASALVEYTPGLLVRQNLRTGSRTTLLDRGANRLFSASLSHDDRWLAFAVGKPDGKSGIYVAPVRTQPVPEKDWVTICESEDYLGSPKWSPNGKLLYYLMERDRECGIWAQRFDPAARKPLGEVFTVFRPNSTRHYMNQPAGNGALTVAPDQLIFYMAESSGNVYLATPKPR